MKLFLIESLFLVQTHKDNLQSQRNTWNLEMLFLEYNSKIPLSHRKSELEMKLEPGIIPFLDFIYNVLQLELEKFKLYIMQKLVQKFIESSWFKAWAPVCCVKNKNRILKLCVYYRSLNQNTIKNRFIFFLFFKIFDWLWRVKYCTKMHISWIYTNDEWEISFWAQYDHFKYKLITFGLTNASTKFWIYINIAFQEYLGLFILVYFHNVLVFFRRTQRMYLIYPLSC